MSTRPHQGEGKSTPLELLILNIDFIQLEHDLNCRVPWVQNSDRKVCADELAKKASELYFMAQKMPPCMQPCCTKEIDVNNKFFEKTIDGNTEMELRFPPTIKFYVEIEVYGIVSMLAGKFRVG